jgi:site-specific recombinase XerD
MIEIVEPAPVALSKTEWNAVRRSAEAAARRDHGLALALANLFRYAGPRVSEVAALQIPDVQISARRGLLIIRRGKGLKHREIPLVQEARDPLDVYFKHREHLAEHWRERARVRGETVSIWSRWPDGHLFLGQRGPLAERGIREIIAKLGQAAKLASPLGLSIWELIWWNFDNYSGDSDPLTYWYKVAREIPRAAQISGME